MTFEQRLNRLERIVTELESDEVELSRALELFQEGVDCLRLASEELSQAQAHVQRLVEHEDGSFELSDLRD